MTFNLWVCLLAGISATAVMTATANAVSTLKRRNYYVIRVLGTMLTGQTTPYKGLSYSRRSIYTGTVVHYLVGCLFSYLFYKLRFVFGDIGILYAFLFGIAAGLVAVIAWRIFFYVHSFPPGIRVSDYVKLIFVSHIVFAVVLFLVYQIFG